MLATGLTERGYAIVSGMARGIDAVAHQAALERGGRTVAVLGCGVDRVYPAEHRELQARIAREGVVISEFPMGSAPEAHRFPQRNRIISGLSLGVVVVEASTGSGSLLTARHALEQGREVFAVPGPITSEKSQGTNRLIQEGAKLVATVADVTEELQLDLRGTSPPPEPSPSDPGELPEEARALFQSLTRDPRHIDDLASAANLPTGRALSLLLSLELAGFVRQLPGTRFVRT
jgi:DNA processing protein